MFSNSKKTNPPAAAKQLPPSILSAGLTVNGDLTSEGEVQIDCLVNGDVTAVRLAIGEKSLAKGEVEIKPRAGQILAVKAEDAVAKLLELIEAGMPKV